MSELPEPDTASLAMSGRSVDYINGYERGYEAAAEQVRQILAAEREANALKCDAEVARLTEQGEPRAAIVAGICAAAIRKGD